MESNRQRLDQLEQSLAGVNTALTEILNNQRGFEERMEERVNLERENHGALMLQLREEQRRFHEEMRTILRKNSATPSVRPRGNPRAGGRENEGAYETPLNGEEEEEPRWNN